VLHDITIWTRAKYLAGAKIYGLLVSAIVARAFLPAVPAFSDTRVEAVA
jgi:hypothetical protein